ncbi:MAG: YezD family protein [Candidatus Omnitrophica bacterium]|nr:YezD family protein [Candidatus Omnitrophota bacterium]
METKTREIKMDEKVLNEIVESIREVNYGEVVVSIHDSKIVQVEKREKKRFQR